MKFDLHIHSKYSVDSILSPDLIIKTAMKNDLNGVAVTDHNTIKGGIETYKINKNHNFEVVVGSEIKTECGDIVGLFLNEEIKSKTFESVIDEIKSQDGLCVLPHPYRCHKRLEDLVKKVDLVEGFNSRSTKRENRLAKKFAEQYGKAITGVSDAHTIIEIGKGVTIVQDDLYNSLKKGNTEVEGEESNYWLAHGTSILIEQYIINKQKIFKYIKHN